MKNTIKKAMMTAARLLVVLTMIATQFGAFTPLRAFAALTEVSRETINAHRQVGSDQTSGIDILDSCGGNRIGKATVNEIVFVQFKLRMSDGSYWVWVTSSSTPNGGYMRADHLIAVQKLTEVSRVTMNVDRQVGSDMSQGINIFDSCAGNWIGKAKANEVVYVQFKLLMSDGSYWVWATSSSTPKGGYMRPDHLIEVQPKKLTEVSRVTMNVDRQVGSDMDQGIDILDECGGKKISNAKADEIVHVTDKLTMDDGSVWVWVTASSTHKAGYMRPDHLIGVQIAPLTDDEFIKMFAEKNNCSSRASYWAAMMENELYSGNFDSAKQNGFEIMNSEKPYDVKSSSDQYAAGWREINGFGTVRLINIKGSDSDIADWIGSSGNFNGERGPWWGFKGTQAVHGGYLVALQYIRNSIEAQGIYRPDKKNEQHYFIIGHSRGGALAEMLALRLVDEGVSPDNIVVYTHGAAPYGSQWLWQYAHERGIDAKVYKTIGNRDPLCAAAWIYGNRTQWGTNNTTIAGWIGYFTCAELANPGFLDVAYHMPETGYLPWLREWLAKGYDWVPMVANHYPPDEANTSQMSMSPIGIANPQSAIVEIAPLPADNAQTIDGLTAIPTELGFNFDWVLPANKLGYRIYRSTVKGEAGISISDFPIVDVTSYFDPNVKVNTTYYYSIAPVVREAFFDEATVTLIPEVVGERSGQIELKIVPAPTPSPNPNEPIESPMPTAAPPDNGKGFIMMNVDDPDMNVNGERKPIDPPPGLGATPIIDNNRVVVPFRAVVEVMGGTADWLESTKQITMKALGHVILMHLGKTEIQVDGAPSEMDVPVKVSKDRTVVPVRFVAENLGCQIEWIGSIKRVVIVYDKAKAK